VVNLAVTVVRAAVQLQGQVLPPLEEQERRVKEIMAGLVRLDHQIMVLEAVVVLAVLVRLEPRHKAVTEVRHKLQTFQELLSITLAAVAVQLIVELQILDLVEEHQQRLKKVVLVMDQLSLVVRLYKTELLILAVEAVAVEAQTK
jgi:hypothetical protein